MVWQLVRNLVEGIGTGLQMAYAPQTVTNLATRQNTQDQIAANFEMKQLD